MSPRGESRPVALVPSRDIAPCRGAHLLPIDTRLSVRVPLPKSRSGAPFQHKHGKGAVVLGGGNVADVLAAQAPIGLQHQ